MTAVVALLGRMGVAPRPFLALVRALWIMDLRGQHFARSTGVKPSFLMSPLFWVVGQCLTISCATSLFLYARVDVGFFAFANLTVGILVLATMVLVEFNEVVLDPHDRDTIGHRPLEVRTYAAARLANLGFYVGLMWAALTMYPAIVGIGLRDAGLGYFPAYLIASLSGSAVAVAVVVWTLSTGGRHGGSEQLRDILAWTQILLILVIGYGGQYVFRDDTHEFFLWAAFPPSWTQWVPTKWLADFVEAASIAPSAGVLGVAVGLVGLGSLAIASLVFRLGQLYRSTQPVAARPARPMDPAQVGRLSAGPLAPLVPSATQRAGFWLCLRMLARDGNLKMRVILPLNTAVAVTILGVATRQFANPMVESEPARIALPLVAVYAVALSMAPVLYNLRLTEFSEASWLLRTAPLARPEELTIGAAKAVWFVLLAPGCALLGGVMGLVWADPLSAALHATWAWLLAWPMGLGGVMLLGPALPFSQPTSRGASFGPLAMPMAVLSCVASAIGVAHALTADQPLAWLAGLVGVVAASMLLRRQL